MNNILNTSIANNAIVNTTNTGFESIFNYNIEDIEFQSATALICSFITWATIYFIITFSIDQSPEYCTRLVTLIHGLLTTVMGAYVCKKKFEDKIEGLKSIPSFMMVNSWGYFVFDLLWCLWYQTETKLMIVHHIYSVYALARMLFLSSWTTTACCGLGAMELTNPLLQARWFIRTYGLMRTKIYSMVEVIFMTTFILIRGLGGTIYIIYVLYTKHIILEVKIVIIIIYILSLLFMLNMYKYVKAHYVVAINAMEKQPSQVEGTESDGVILPDSS